MKKIIEINEKDISEIIAAYFHVKQSDVLVRVESVYEDYGHFEHKVNKCFARIIMEDNDERVDR